MDGVCAVKAFCNPSFSTNADDVKSVHVVLTDNGKPCFGHCTCTVGLRKDCAHVGALSYVLCEIVAEGLTELPADPACTDILCPWAEPKGSHCDPIFAEDIGRARNVQKRHSSLHLQLLKENTLLLLKRIRTLKER